MPIKRTRPVVSEAEATSIIGLSIQTVKGDRPLFEKVNLRSNVSKESLPAESGAFPPAPLVEMSDSFCQLQSFTTMVEFDRICLGKLASGSGSGKANINVSGGGLKVVAPFPH